MALIPPELRPKLISQTQQKKLDRIAERDQKRAERKLILIDKIFGVGKGPAKLRERMMERLGF